MKNMVVAAGILLTLGLGYIFITPAMMGDPCDTRSLKVSTQEIGLQDIDFLKIRLGYSFGNKLGNYSHKLQAANASVYYKKKKTKPWLTYLSTSFNSKSTAKSAYRHLKRKWKNNKKNQYDVMIKDNTVTWFSNSRFTPQCFAQVVASAKKNMGAQEPAPVLAKRKVKAKKKVASKKKVSKKKRRRKKTAKKRSKKSRRTVVAKKNRGKR